MSKVLILPDRPAWDQEKYGFGPHQATRLSYTNGWLVTFSNGRQCPFDDDEVVRFPAHRGEYDPTNYHEDNDEGTYYYNATAPRLAKHREDDTYFTTPAPF